MKLRIKDLERQLDRLEPMLLFPPELPPNVLWMPRFKKRGGLGRGERLVEDQYEDAKGDSVLTMERVTAEPSDSGKRFPFKFWSRQARKLFRDLEKYARHHPVKVERVRWREGRPMVGAKDGSLAPLDQPLSGPVSERKLADDPDQYEDRCANYPR
jgi:hypothetical protein